jgi:hypothetical protein
VVNQEETVMATYEITSPDGQTYEVTAPDNASEAAVLAYAKTQFEKQSAPSLSPEQIAEQKQRAMKSMVRAERSPIGNVVGDIAAGATALGGKLFDIPSKMLNAPWLRSEMGQAQDVADKGSMSYLAGGMLDPLAQAAGCGRVCCGKSCAGHPETHRSRLDLRKERLGWRRNRSRVVCGSRWRCG